MRARAQVVAALVVLASLGSGTAAVAILPPVDEQLVEGHTVFAVIERARAAQEEEEEFAAAVAVLVREIRHSASYVRFPGVLWMNDQYLVGPTSDSSEDFVERFPCTGAVLLVPEGATDPRRPVADFNASTYVESYHITDPNDRAWDVDLWNFTGDLVWTVAIVNDPAGYSIEDDDTCDGFVFGSRCGSMRVPGYGCVRGVHVQGFSSNGRDPGDNGRGYPCGDDTNGCSPILYNALLYVRLKDLQPSGEKDHEEGSADWNDDVSGCHGTYTGEWECPDGDDDREGNSHPYNPEPPFASYDGLNNHGGSGDCDGDGAVDGPPVGGYYYTGDYNCHATVRVDIYYGVAALPPERNYWLIDAVGGTAPYHCHDANAFC